MGILGLGVSDVIIVRSQIIQLTNALPSRESKVSSLGVEEDFLGIGEVVPYVKVRITGRMNVLIGEQVRTRETTGKE